MTAENILASWKKKQFAPVTWLEGEEDFYIDQLIDYAEHKILPEAEAGFNLTVFYGKDAQWTDVINACRRYPMFADKQVVILKEAQQMKDLDKLEPYIAQPSPTTIFVVAHKEKKLDGRSKLAKLLKDQGVVFSTRKLYDNQLPEWTQDYIQSQGLQIQRKALMLLVDHIGNDLARIANEVQKLTVNLGSRREILEDDIEQFIGVSKEYNVTELQNAFIRKDLPKAVRIIQYFQSNPKAAPIQLILPSLFNFFSRTYQVFGLGQADEKSIASALGINPYFAKDYSLAAKTYGFEGVERNLLLLHEYNLRSVGVHDAGTEDGELLKELVVKMMR